MKKKQLLAGVLLAGGLVVLAAVPASAHSNVVTLTETCKAGAPVVNVHLANDFDLTETVSYSGALSATANVGKLGVDDHQIAATGTVTVNAHGVWSDGFTRTDSASLTVEPNLCAPQCFLPEGCDTPTTTVPPTPPTTTAPPVVVGDPTPSVTAPPVVKHAPPVAATPVLHAPEFTG